MIHEWCSGVIGTEKDVLISDLGVLIGHEEKRSILHIGLISLQMRNLILYMCNIWMSMIGAVE